MVVVVRELATSRIVTVVLTVEPVTRCLLQSNGIIPKQSFMTKMLENPTHSLKRRDGVQGRAPRRHRLMKPTFNGLSER